jgi:signal transduction histidine kinase
LQARSQRTTYELLSAYRTFALGVAALQIVLTATPGTRLASYIILGILGIYSLIRLFLPRFRRFRDGYPGLALDVVFCLAPLFLTGGLASPFLFYSLCAIIYAALIFPRIAAIICASLSSASLIITILLAGTAGTNYAFAGIYVIACFLVAIMPYTTNLSIYRRLEEDAVLKERKRLARELHDTVAQTLAYVNLKATLVTDTLAKGNLQRALKELEQMKESLDSTYDEVRQAINTLGQSRLDEIDFMSALSHQVHEFSRKNDLKSRISVAREELRLSPETANELLHIVSEAMVNVRKHAQATVIEVESYRNGHRLEILVKDNGVGFNLEEYEDTRPTGEHHGLDIMKERAESMGGTLAIYSHPGAGTELKAIIPLEWRYDYGQ